MMDVTTFGQPAKLEQLGDGEWKLTGFVSVEMLITQNYSYYSCDFDIYGGFLLKMIQITVKGPGQGREGYPPPQIRIEGVCIKDIKFNKQHELIPSSILMNRNRPDIICIPFLTPLDLRAPYQTGDLKIGLTIAGFKEQLGDCIMIDFGYQISLLEKLMDKKW